MNSHLAVKIDGQEMTLLPDQTIDVENRNPLFNDTEMFSYPFNPPFDLNRHLFKNLDDPDSDMRPIVMEHKPAQIFGEGLPLASGVTVVQEDETLTDSMNMNIDASTRSFEDLIGDLECRDVPLKDKIQVGEKIGNVNVSVTYDYEVEADVGKKDWIKQRGTIGPVSGTFEPQALGFSYPGIWQETTGYAAVPSSKEKRRDYDNGKTVIVPEVTKSFINVSSEYGSTVNSPYKDEQGQTIAWPFCNARVCYKHYALDESDKEKTSDRVVLPKDGKYQYEDYGPYWVLDANRPQSGLCFYVLYFLDCLFEHLGVMFDKTALIGDGTAENPGVKDFTRLCFFTTHHKYYTEPTGKTLSGFEAINKWLTSRGCGGTLSVEEPDVKSLDSFEFATFGDYEVGKEDVRQIKSSATIKTKTITAEVLNMYATSDNFPDTSVQEVLNSLEAAFGIRFYYDYEKNKVTAYLLRTVFRDTDNIIDFHGEVLETHKMTEKITGFQQKYSAEGTAKEQQEYVRRQKRDYDTDFDYIEYPENRTVLDKTYSQIFQNISANDMHVYVDLTTGDAYRIKVSSDATTASELRPVLFEVGALHGIEVGDCSPENDDFVQKYEIGFQPIMFNDVNYYRELLVAQGSVDVQTDQGTKRVTIKSDSQPVLAAFIDEDMEHEFVPSKINNVITNVLVDIYLSENLELVESYDPSKTDDGNSPLQAYDWGLSVAMMRGGGTNMEVQQFDYDYDGFSNSKWRTVAGLYALATDSLDPMGNEYDYNGTASGIGPGERFSLKVTGYKPFRYKYVDGKLKISTNPKEWSDASWLVPCNADVVNSQTHEIEKKIRTRGLYDTFMSELCFFLLNRKKYKLKVMTTVAQLADIPNHWLSRWRIGGRTGYIDKVKYQLSVEKETREAEIDFYAI